jgi:hypothetical protein
MRKAFAAALMAFSLTGCATIMHGNHQEVGFSSTPTGAQVTVDNKPLGVTPTTASLTRKDKHVVRIEMAGYQPYELQLTRQVDGWVVGNIVFGGVIGLAVDAINGSMYKISPSAVNGTLSTQTAMTGSDAITIAVVLTPQPGWEKIGEMQPVVDLGAR